MSRCIALILALATGAVALRPQCRTSLAPRRDFLGAAAAAATTLLPQAAHATGKATQKTLFLRYEKRIAGLGSYFDELEAAISNADWAAVTTACEADTSKKGKIGPVKPLVSVSACTHRCGQSIILNVTVLCGVAHRQDTTTIMPS